MQNLSDIRFQYTFNYNQFENVFLPREDNGMPGFCKSFKRIITAAPVTKRSKAPG